MLAERKPDGARVTVDMARYELRDALSGKKTVSEPMCVALDLLKTQGTVSCEAFAQACFSLRTYDSLVHNGKIFNLLARLKKLTGGEPRFRMKSGFVLADGAWDGITIRKAHVSPAHLRFSPEWKSLLYGSPDGAPVKAPVPKTPQADDVASDLPLDRAITRAEL